MQIRTVQVLLALTRQLVVDCRPNLHRQVTDAVRIDVSIGICRKRSTMTVQNRVKLAGVSMFAPPGVNVSLGVSGRTPAFAL
jgi:hypothetical protein